MQAVRYIPQQQIDRHRWDACIRNAANGLVYGYAVYLDAMARNWDALVLNDYEAVMPLTFNKKYGIHYLYQPPFTAALGVFGRAVSAELLQAFLKAIPRKFRYADISLNHGNFFSIPGFALYRRTNYILPLHEPYDVMYSRYRDNIKRNIKKCIQQGCVVNKSISVQDVAALAKQQAAAFSNLTEKDFASFCSLYAQLQSQGQAALYGISTKSGGLLASCVFFFSHNRAYYILVGNHPNGKTMGASHALIDAFIKDHAGSNLLLDFEGSDIRNLAFFYSSFGATEEEYAGLRMNRLPALLRWLKKN